MNDEQKEYKASDLFQRKLKKWRRLYFDFVFELENDLLRLNIPTEEKDNFLKLIINSGNYTSFSEVDENIREYFLKKVSKK